MSEPLYRDVLAKLVRRCDLTHDEAYALFTDLMDGRLTEAQIAGVLIGLATKGECVPELAGAAQAMREHAVRIDVGDADVIDIVGTGGTGIKTFNISTTSCFVAAGAGAKVAKHGNVTNTRPSGAADVLRALGVNIEAAPDVVHRCVAEAGIGFCYARICHPAMQYAAAVRKQLPVRTIFNVLGPLTNPAGARRQLMGVFADEWTEPLAEVLGQLGATRAWVVHAKDGLDEISITTVTRISEVRGGKITTRTIQPEDFGLKRARLEDLSVDSPQASAAVVREVLDGKPGPARDVVLLNAAAALTVADRAETMQAGLAQAEAAIDSGAAREALDTLIRQSHG